jgi:DeoR/GlpR family transcriptional regulator of sugar metabolism
MLTARRKELLLDMLQRDGVIVAKTVAASWQLSEDTIRRDLRELAAEGKLQRVHGGALPASLAMGDFAARRTVGSAGKAAIGAAAAGMVEAGQTIVLDGGTTAQQMARQLPAGLQATVITHSPTIALELVQHSGVEVILIGGRLFKHSIVTSGAMASEAIERIRADSFFMGVTGVHPTAGLTTGDAEEAATKRALSRRCAETYVLASAEKIGAASPFTVIALDQTAAVITDADAPRASLSALRKRGVRVIRAT